MLKVAIVGCGKIADSHAAQIRRVEGCQLVGVCDREELMARQLAERFDVPRCFDSLEQLLADCHPDVVHVTTSPESHFGITRSCLENGCHVYVEKPFTLNTPEAEELIGLADQAQVKITAGHDDQFSPAARDMRALVESGFLGGAPVHMESHYCYQFQDSYGKAILADKQHWVRKLPGKLLHNIISHGIARIAEHLETDDPEVMVHASRSPFLRQSGEKELVDELRAIISDRRGTTAYFTFSSQMRPSLHEFRIYGEKNGLILDHDHQTVVKLEGTQFKSYAEKFIPPVILARQYVGSAARNMRRFLANNFHMKSGMKFLIDSFYKAVRGEQAVPISYREILLTSRIMDEIFGQISKQMGSWALDQQKKEFADDVQAGHVQP